MDWRGLSSQGSRLISKFGIGVSQHTYEKFKKDTSEKCYQKTLSHMNKNSCVMWIDNFDAVCII